MARSAPKQSLEHLIPLLILLDAAEVVCLHLIDIAVTDVEE